MKDRPDQAVVREAERMPVEGPTRLLAILAVSVFTIELAVMATFAILPSISRWLEVFLDALLLVIFLFPVLYLWVFRPFRTLIIQQELAEKELAAANEQLQQDIVVRKQIEEALRKSEARFRDTLEDAPIGMAVTAVDGSFLQVNQAFCDILGYRKSELERMGYADITFPDDLADSAANVERLLDGGQRSFQMENRYLNKNGRLIWVKMSCSVHFDVDKAPLYFIIQIEDITEFKNASERARLLTNVFEHSIEPIVITDSANRIVEINPAFTELTGYALHEVQGKDPRIFSAHGQVQTPGFYKGMWLCLLNEGYWNGELWDKRKNGSVFLRWVTITVVRDEEGRIINYIASYADISSLQKREHSADINMPLF